MLRDFCCLCMQIEWKQRCSCWHLFILRHTVHIQWESFSLLVMQFQFLDNLLMQMFVLFSISLVYFSFWWHN